MGEDVRRGNEVFARRVSTTGAVLGREAVFELSSEAGSGEGVAETSGCLALAGVDEPSRGINFVRTFTQFYGDI